jgi:hypothetical protein
MNLQQVISNLARLAGPVTPFYGMEEMETERSEMIANSSREFEDYLFEILKTPIDSKSLQSASIEDFYLELSDIIVEIGSRDPSRFLERLRLLIDTIYNRTVLIEIIGGLRDHKGVSLLKRLLADATLTSEELVALACSLGMIGGEEAIGILMEMKKKYCSQVENVMQEIEIALHNNGIT